MKKLIFGLSVLALSSFSMMAQNTSDNAKCNKAQTECNNSATCQQPRFCNGNTENCNPCVNCPGPSECKNVKNCKANENCTEAKTCNLKRKKGGCPIERDFNGIQLTETQKKKITDLYQARRAERESAKADLKKNKQLQGEQMKNLKADFRTKRLEGKKKFLADIKQILTPEQYTEFLENNYMQSGRSFDKGHAFHKSKKGHKGFGHDRKRKGFGDSAGKKNKRGNGKFGRDLNKEAK